MCKTEFISKYKNTLPPVILDEKIIALQSLLKMITIKETIESKEIDFNHYLNRLVSN